MTLIEYTYQRFGFKLNSRLSRRHSKKATTFFPIHGTIVKDNRFAIERMVIPILITYKRVTIQSVCMVQTSISRSYLTDETLTALGLEMFSSEATLDVHLQGKPVTVSPSLHYFTELNACGQSFFSEFQLKLEIDHKKQQVIITQAADNEKQSEEPPLVVLSMRNSNTKRAETVAW